jgi:spore coat polysaccharide biosynthesis predicted glycosyltransferase SpsG
LKTNPNILICPLEWGLGHAARMIPMAIKLRELNFNVIIGTGKEHQVLYRTEIPGIVCIDFPGFKPVYSKYLPQYFSLFLKIPWLIYHIVSEHGRLKRIIREHKIDIVISDNRFGLWNRKIKTIYVTHQLRIPFPKAFRLFEFIGIALHRAVIRKYSFCFIPDLPGDMNLSGRLSHGIKLPVNAMYIGILSRFEGIDSTPGDSPVSGEYNTVILSGPEPQRTLLKQKLTGILKNRYPKSVILGGRPDLGSTGTDSENIVYYNHLPAAAMRQMIAESRLIITRSGYTSIMELISLNRTALLIPTPGQTEQEYLAGYLSEKGWFASVLQKDLKEEMPEVITQTAPRDAIMTESRRLLEVALKRLSED